MNALFHTTNRHKLSSKLSDSAVVLSAYSSVQRSNDTAQSFKQEANFWYLTGINRPDWRLIMEGSSSYLVAPQVDSLQQLFDGSLTSAEAKRISGVDRIVTHDEGITLLRTIAVKHSMAYCIDQPARAEHFSFVLNPAITNNKRLLERTFSAVEDCGKTLNELRAIKQPEEIAAIQKAVNLTVDAFTGVHKQMANFRNEYELEASFSYHFRSKGAVGHAYDPIIGSGANACTLHYIANNAKLTKKQLVLMDVGAEVDGFAADISRTYAYGEPTKRQKSLHAAVEAAHQQIVKLIAPRLSVEQYQRQVDEIMTQAIKSLDLYVNESSLRRYFPHAISHGLGIDVHDSLGAPKYFAENMVLTVEPGIYIPEEGIGVRIEDDILVTKSNYKNMSNRLSTGL